MDNLKAPNISHIEVWVAICMEIETAGTAKQLKHLYVLAVVFLWKWFHCCWCLSALGLSKTPEAGLF